MYHVDEVVKAFGKQGAERLWAEKQKAVAGSLEAVLNCGRVLPSSLCRVPGGLLGMMDRDDGRQILHVTFGSVLTEKTSRGYRFRERIRKILRQNQKLHEDVLRNHLGKHIRALLPG